jgi:hypothetical protein
VAALFVASWTASILPDPICSTGTDRTTTVVTFPLAYI